MGLSRLAVVRTDLSSGQRHGVGCLWGKLQPEGLMSFSKELTKFQRERSGPRAGSADLETLKPVEMKECTKAFLEMSVEGEIVQDGRYLCGGFSGEWI